MKVVFIVVFFQGIFGCFIAQSRIIARSFYWHLDPRKRHLPGKLVHKGIIMHLHLLQDFLEFLTLFKDEKEKIQLSPLVLNIIQLLHVSKSNRKETSNELQWMILFFLTRWLSSKPQVYFYPHFKRAPANVQKKSYKERALLCTMLSSPDIVESKRFHRGLMF